jgi:hypothetical protein
MREVWRSLLCLREVCKSLLCFLNTGMRTPARLLLEESAKVWTARSPALLGAELPGAESETSSSCGALLRCSTGLTYLAADKEVQ